MYGSQKLTEQDCDGTNKRVYEMTGITYYNNMTVLGLFLLLTSVM